MSYLDKRGTGIAAESLVRHILLIVFLFVAGAIVLFWMTGFNTQTMKTYGCWMANGVMSSNPILRANIGVPCKNDMQRELFNAQKLDKFLVDTWFMYGKGDWDFHVEDDDAIMVTGFQVSEEVTMTKLFETLLTHKNGRSMVKNGKFDVSKIDKSDYNYIQSESGGQNLCFDKSLKPSSGKKATLTKGTPYYIHFWDDISNILNDEQMGDKIVIAKSDSIGFNDPIYCCTLKQGTCITLNQQSTLVADALLVFAPGTALVYLAGKATGTFDLRKDITQAFGSRTPTTSPGGGVFK